MKVYRVTIIDAHEGTCYGWAATKGAAYLRAQSMLNEMGREGDPFKDNVTFDEVVIESCPQGFAEWLDRNFKRDNG